MSRPALATGLSRAPVFLVALTGWVLALAAAPSVARAYAFSLTGDGGSQTLTWFTNRTEVAGRREVAWDGVGARGERVGPGIYVVELQSGPRRTIAKLVLLGR